MGRIKGIGDLRRQLGGELRWQAAALAEDIAQATTRHQLHDDVAGPILDTHVKDLHDPRVGQTRRRASLSHAARLESGFRDQLDGDGAIEQLVVCAVDAPHATVGDRLVQPITATEQTTKFNGHGRCTRAGCVPEPICGRRLQWTVDSSLTAASAYL